MNIKGTVWLDIDGHIINTEDTVYALVASPYVHVVPSTGLMMDFKEKINVQPLKVKRIYQCESGEWIILVTYERTLRQREEQIRAEWFGKTVFYTEEEAEYALKYYDQKILRYDSKELLKALADANRDRYLNFAYKADVGKISDGYHTFDELYDHRTVLYAALCNAYPELSWKSRLHEDGTMYDGMFIAGLNLPNGEISYHIENKDRWGRSNWELFKCREIPRALHFTGYTPDDVVDRLIMHCGVDPSLNQVQSDEEACDNYTKIGSDYFSED